MMRCEADHLGRQTIYDRMEGFEGFVEFSG